MNSSFREERQELRGITQITAVSKAFEIGRVGFDRNGIVIGCGDNRKARLMQAEAEPSGATEEVDGPGSAKLLQPPPGLLGFKGQARFELEPLPANVREYVRVRQLTARSHSRRGLLLKTGHVHVTLATGPAVRERRAGRLCWPCRMAREKVIVCDNCQRRVDPALLVQLRLMYSRGAGIRRVADLCESCAGALPGRVLTKASR